jgi:hypothetical protein
MTRTAIDLIPATAGRAILTHMNKRHDLATIVNCVPEEDLAGLSVDDVLVLLHGLPRQAFDPAVTAARKRLASAILRNSPAHPERGRRSH